MAKLSDRILGERLSGFVTKPNILDNSNFQVRQRGDSDTTGNGGTFFDRWPTPPTSVTGGTTELLYEGEADYDDEHWVKVTAAGHTAPWYMSQKWLIANGRITAGENYTFTVSTEVLSAPIKAKVFIRGYDVSAGNYYTLAEGDIELDSNKDVSIVLVPVHQQGSDLTGVGDYFEVGFTGEGANNGSDFVLPDGSYRFKTLKLEEGNVYTGYEPTPYAVDELECMKWFEVLIQSELIYPYPYVSVPYSGFTNTRWNWYFKARKYSLPTITATSWSPAKGPAEQINLDYFSASGSGIFYPSATGGVGSIIIQSSCEL